MLPEAKPTYSATLDTGVAPAPTGSVTGTGAPRPRRNYLRMLAGSRPRPFWRRDTDASLEPMIEAT